MPTQSTSTSIQLLLTAEQKATIVADLKAVGMYDDVGNSVKETLGLSDPPAGLFARVYADIYNIIKDSPAVDDNTKFWFSAAGAINGNDRSSQADRFIRGVTQYGLTARGRLNGYSQSQIDVGIQRTSNLIGQNVITQILQSGPVDGFGAIPSFQTMLRAQVQASAVHR